MQWEHVEAVLRGQLPYWFTAMRAWSTEGCLLYGAFVLACLCTLRTLRCK